MEFILETDPRRFAERVMPFLEGAVEHNMPATILRGLTEAGSSDRPPLLVIGIHPTSAVAAVALRVPPLPMICTALPEPGCDADRLLDVCLSVAPELDAVNAPVGTARALIDALQRRTGRQAELRLATTLHSLTEVRQPPHPAPGRLRTTHAEDLELLIDWLERFCAETGASFPDLRAAIRTRRDADSLWLWTDETEQPVCLVGANPPVAGIPRVAPVYTPPAARRHGYAGSAVAAVSRQLLGRGARACALFTDQANPTSNRIYRAVGYQPIGDWEEYILS